MNRADYAYQPLSLDQYEQIVTAGTMQGTSPLHGQVNYAALIRESVAFNVDPRVLCAALLWEDHFGSDPGGGVALAAVFNFAGVKWANQPGAYDSRIQVPANEQPGTYAGFPDIGAGVHEIYRTLTNQYCGPYFNAGDLRNAWSVYVKGYANSPSGQERVDQWQYYLAHYPPQVSDNPNPPGVYGEDLIAKARQFIGQPNSDGSLDPWNGWHAWAYWCEAFAEGVPISLGLTEVHRGSAAIKLDNIIVQGLLQQGTPEHGAWCLFGRSFDPNGHICFWDDDKKMFLGTLTNGTGIGYHDQSWMPFMAGWCRVPGVVGDRRKSVPGPSPPPADYRLFAETKHGVYGDFKGFWEQYGDDEKSVAAFGYPISERESAVCEDGATRTVQWCERARFEDWGGGLVKATRLGALWLRQQGRHGAGID